MIANMVAEGAGVVGGPLATFHQRYSPHAFSALKSVVSPYVKAIVNLLAGDGDLVQVTPNLRVHRPGQPTAIPFHSDTLYGHSHDEINYWLVLTPASGTNALWMVSDQKTEELHAQLRAGMSLGDFNRLAQSMAEPVEASQPGLFTFCCSQIHGSVLNETPFTRVSLDFRMLPKGAKPNVKKNGYFRPKWLPDFACPLEKGSAVTTVSSLDLPIPVYMQRMHMLKFFPQSDHRELVEFHNMDHAPTLEDAMLSGAVIAYSISQIKRPVRLLHPIGFADENVWFVPETQWAFDKFLASR